MEKLLIAGPCSAESREQVLEIASALAGTGCIFRAGIWKPRTRPNQFDGVGTVGLDWMVEVRETFGLEIVTEVANVDQLNQVRMKGFKHIWIGARTSTNPFSVEEIAAATPKDFTVYIKNPMNPDLDLWSGAVERFENRGITNIKLIHRGFSVQHPAIYRNEPIWAIAFDMMLKYPKYQMIGDASHIAGNSQYILELLLQMQEYNYGGYMVETHNHPEEAWTDAKQQITPTFLKVCMDRLASIEKSSQSVDLSDLRKEVDTADLELLRLLVSRMTLSYKIGDLKAENNMPIFDLDRYAERMDWFISKGYELGLTKGFSESLFKIIHAESVYKQSK